MSAVTPLFLLLLPIVVIVGWFGMPMLYRKASVRRLAALCRRRRAIVLSYDDGPGSRLTSQIADLLARRDVRATFFVIGANVQRHPEVIGRLRDDGHEIASHTQDHLNAWKTGPLRPLRDISAGIATLAGQGVASRLFRPPYGKMTPATLHVCRRLGQRVAFWTHDSRDSWNRLPVAALIQGLQASGGGVVLMHDFDRPARGPFPDDHERYVLDLTETLIDFAEENGFALLRFGDLFEESGMISGGKGKA